MAPKAKAKHPDFWYENKALHVCALKNALRTAALGCIRLGATKKWFMDLASTVFDATAYSVQNEARILRDTIQTDIPIT